MKLEKLMRQNDELQKAEALHRKEVENLRLLDAERQKELAALKMDNINLCKVDAQHRISRRAVADIPKTKEEEEEENLKRIMVRDGVMSGRGLMMRGRGFMLTFHLSEKSRITTV